MRQATPEQKLRAAERRAVFKLLAKQVVAMTDAQRADMASLMVGLVTCEGHPLSFHNTCLLASQYPTATMVGGFRQWLRHGRCVAKGQHGLMIWVPKRTGAAKGGDGAALDDQQADAPRSDRDEVRFLVGTVFDISQTVEIGVGEPVAVGEST